MYWSTRRRLVYAIGVIVFFGIIFGGPVVYKVLTIPPTCSDGKRNQGETAIDRGGPCLILDQSNLQPSPVMWARAFKVRDGSYSAVAYVENPNIDAGVRAAHYLFKMYDSENILVAERKGTTFIMPSGITPVFEGGVETGKRVVAHTFFSLSAPLVWERMKDMSQDIRVSDEKINSVNTKPRLTATLHNISVVPLYDIFVVAVVFDTAGNAFTASQTNLQRLEPDETNHVVFTWPDSFPESVGRIDVIPLVAPVSSPELAP